MRLLEALLARRRGVVALWLALAAAAAPGLLRLSVDNSAEVFFVRDAERLERYRRFQMDFGRDRAVRLVVSGAALRTREGLTWLGDLEQRAAALPDVFGAAGLWRHHGSDRQEQGMPAWPPEDPEAFWAEVGADPLDRQAGFAVGSGLPGEETATILVALYNVPARRQEETLRRLEAMLAPPPRLGSLGPETASLRTAVVGLPVVQRAIDREVAAFARRLLPLLALAAVGLLALVFRRPGAVLLPLVPTGVSLGIVFGLRGALGRPINMVEVLLAPLLFVLALATAVHVQMRFRELRRSMDATEAVLHTYREKGWPVLWTGITTMAGFGSLAVSGVPPVRSLGVWSAGGLALITLVLLTLFPALLALVPEGSSRRRRLPLVRHDRRYDRWAAARGRAWATTAVARRGRVFLVFAIVALLAVTGAVRLQRDTNLLSYFPAGHPVRSGIERLERLGVGAVAAEVVIDVGPCAPFLTPEGLEALARLGDSMRREPEVLSVIGAGEVWRSVGSLDELASRPELEDLLTVLRTRDGRQARLSVLLPMRGFEELEPLLDRLPELARAAFPGARVRLTGRYPLVLAALHGVFATMIASLSLTFLVVAGIFGVLLRNGRLTVAALIPNLWPVLCVLGAMGWLGVPVDSTTVMIASVVLGLVVDDTFHTLGRFRYEVGGSAISALQHTAPAHLLTSMVLVAGFGVCGLSGFVPIARFGALMALALGLALAADLLLVPALLVGLRPPTRGAEA